MTPDLRVPSDQEFQLIREYIHEFELDNRDLQAAQFIAAFRSGELAGFGRLRKHPDCTELCSLGVITPLRRRGIGRAIVTELIKHASSDIYLACIIPDFFISFGFQVTEKFPSSILNKLNYCSEELIVPEKYVAMVRAQNK
jgi:N-acetylglutamate synthase-like GNAT family acetyltransferase